MTVTRSPCMSWGTRDGHITSITQVMDTWILEDLRLDR
jgi:hypothetical protein